MVDIGRLREWCRSVFENLLSQSVNGKSSQIVDGARSHDGLSGYRSVNLDTLVMPLIIRNLNNKASP
jgi:hypothetical protein